MAGTWPGASPLWPRGEPTVARVRAPAAIRRRASGAAAAPRLERAPTGLLVLRLTVAQGRGAFAPGGARGASGYDRRARRPSAATFGLAHHLRAATLLHGVV